MANSSVSVKVHGVPALVRALKDIDTKLPGSMKEHLLAIAKSVAGKAASKVPHLTGTAAASIKPRATTRGASIAFGGTAAPYMPWLDFGGSVGRNKSVHRAFIKQGRFIYPTIKEEGHNIETALDEAIREVSEEAGFTTHG